MSESLRIDKWLWYARFFKSRSVAAKLCDGRRVRLNRRVIDKASRTVRVGDVLTFPQGREVRVVRVRGLGLRRGPASEAEGLYEDLLPPAKRSGAPPPAGHRERGTGRPTKADRRAIEALEEPG